MEGGVVGGPVGTSDRSYRPEDVGVMRLLAPLIGFAGLQSHRWIQSVLR
jgi:hypothetical protein